MNKKDICNYREFDSDNNYPSVRSAIGDKNENKDKILSYLNHFEQIVAITRPITDYISGEDKRESVYGYTDGGYWWTNEQVYHFEKYDMKLNDDFIKYVLKTA